MQAFVQLPGPIKVLLYLSVNIRLSPHFIEASTISGISADWADLRIGRCA